jgi:hypothetical protein
MSRTVVQAVTSAEERMVLTRSATRDLVMDPNLPKIVAIVDADIKTA